MVAIVSNQIVSLDKCWMEKCCTDRCCMDKRCTDRCRMDKCCMVIWYWATCQQSRMVSQTWNVLHGTFPGWGGGGVRSLPFVVHYLCGPYILWSLPIVVHTLCGLYPLCWQTGVQYECQDIIRSLLSNRNKNRNQNFVNANSNWIMIKSSSSLVLVKQLDVEIAPPPFILSVCF